MRLGFYIKGTSQTEGIYQQCTEGDILL